MVVRHLKRCPEPHRAIFETDRQQRTRQGLSRIDGQSNILCPLMRDKTGTSVLEQGSPSAALDRQREPMQVAGSSSPVFTRIRSRVAIRFLVVARHDRR